MLCGSLDGGGIWGIMDTYMDGWVTLLCTWNNTTALIIGYVLIVVQSPSHVWLFATPWTATHQAFLFFTISQSLPKFMFIASVMPSSRLILWCRLLLLPSIFPSIRDFSNELAVHIREPKCWSFSFSIGPSNEYSGLISFKSDWFVFLDFQGIFRCFLQHHSSKASFLQCSAFLTANCTPI